MELVIPDIENSVELGDVKDVLDFLTEVEELEFAARVAHGGEAADEFSDTRTVDVIHVGEVEDDFFLAALNQAVDGIAEIANFVAENDTAVNVENGDVGNFARVNRDRHSGSRGMVVGGKGQVNGGGFGEFGEIPTPRQGSEKSGTRSIGRQQAR